MRSFEKENEIDIVGFFGQLISKIFVTFCLGEEYADTKLEFNYSDKGKKSVSLSEFIAGLINDISARSGSTYNILMGGPYMYSI
jgi:hypothetical protein